MKFLHIIAASALILPAVAVAQSAPGDHSSTSAKAKKGKNHHDAMSAPDAAPADTMAPPPSAEPATTTPPPGATTPAPAPAPDPSAATTPPRS